VKQSLASTEAWLLRRIGIFGWGLVAPKSPDIESFALALESSESWLEPFHGFGPDNFLVGNPSFSFARYRPWIDKRFAPSRFRQLSEKMDQPTLYALGSFIQSLDQNPGIEEELTRLGPKAHVYVGTGLGNLGVIAESTLVLARAQRRWDWYWARRNPARDAFLGLSPQERAARAGVPPEPDTVPPEDRADAEAASWHYWAATSPKLAAYLAEVAAIEALPVAGDVESSKKNVLRERQRRLKRLQEQWQAPPTPWSEVSANLVWNISNTPAAEISMMGRITGLSFAPVAACSTFGVALRLAASAIDRGDATMVVVGATDPPPLPLTVAGFYAARVVAAHGAVSWPLEGMRGTHVAGGAVVWIVGDLEAMQARGFRPLGMEPVAVGVSSDADHIITPSAAGPTSAILQALAEGEMRAEEIGTWDLHATATPGDDTEVATLRGVLPASVLVTARKGTFGHGMSAGGGWELTAQYLGYQRGKLFPTALDARLLSPTIAARHDLFVFDQALDFPPGPVGKLSMGIGGINACVLSRPLAR
jgi:3-oxoacyl-[acyl-carrier-protein] synthase II